MMSMNPADWADLARADVGGLSNKPDLAGMLRARGSSDPAVEKSRRGASELGTGALGRLLL